VPDTGTDRRTGVPDTACRRAGHGVPACRTRECRRAGHGDRAPARQRLPACAGVPDKNRSVAGGGLRGSSRFQGPAVADHGVTRGQIGVCGWRRRVDVGDRRLRSAWFGGLKADLRQRAAVSWGQVEGSLGSGARDGLAPGWGESAGSKPSSDPVPLTNELRLDEIPAARQ